MTRISTARNIPELDVRTFFLVLLSLTSAAISTASLRYSVVAIVACVTLLICIAIARSAAMPLPTIVVAITGTLLSILPATLSFFVDIDGNLFRVIGLGLLVAAIPMVKTDTEISRVSRRVLATTAAKRLIQIVVVVAVLGAAIGVLRANNPSYIVSDTLRLALTAFGIAIGAVVDKRWLQSFIMLSGATIVVIDIAVLSAYAARLAGSGYQRLGGGSILGLSFALMLIASPDLRRRRIGFCVLSLESILIVLSLGRGVWAATAVVGLLAMVIFDREVKKRLVALGAIMVILAMVLPIEQSSATDAVRRRLETTVVQQRDETSIAHRLGEIDSALATLRQLPGGSLVGGGSGATYQELTGETTHHIHSSPVSVYFRHGIIGALSLATLCAFALGMAVLRPLNDTDALTVWAAAVVVGTLILSFSSYVLIGELMPALAIGHLARSHSGHRARQSADRTTAAAR